LRRNDPLTSKIDRDLDPAHLLAAPTYWLREVTRHALMPEGDEPRRADIAQAMSSAWL
jgi:hypothetical protein